MKPTFMSLIWFCTYKSKWSCVILEHGSLLQNKYIQMHYGWNLPDSYQQDSHQCSQSLSYKLSSTNQLHPGRSNNLMKQPWINMYRVNNIPSPSQ